MQFGCIKVDASNYISMTIYCMTILHANPGQGDRFDLKISSTLTLTMTGQQGQWVSLFHSNRKRSDLFAGSLVKQMAIPVSNSLIILVSPYPESDSGGVMNISSSTSSPSSDVSDCRPPKLVTSLWAVAYRWSSPGISCKTSFTFHLPITFPLQRWIRYSVLYNTSRKTVVNFESMQSSVIIKLAVYEFCTYVYSCNKVIK